MKQQKQQKICVDCKYHIVDGFSLRYFCKANLDSITGRPKSCVDFNSDGECEDYEEK